jgi:hypothetical protein
MQETVCTIFLFGGTEMELKIEYLPIKALKPYEKNPRHNDGAIDYVAKSIEQYGFKVPIIVEKDGTIIAGHTRYEASKRLGLETVPCVIAGDLTDEQAKAFRIADNKVSDYSIWDNKLLLEELEDIGEDLFTGFDFGDIFDFDVLDEQDNSVVDSNENGVTYECVIRSSDKSKIEKIQKIWEEMSSDE